MGWRPPKRVKLDLVFGASVYETLVVRPAWSRQPPESFVGFVGAPIIRMNIAAIWKRRPRSDLFCDERAQRSGGH
jgi:hypothetical protein